ncbi:BQ2448_2966 [Microbotryum intermedium]|uniref:BQ2448_2966 protein n=1 Tax=Microbotryum intermedium TaxID=269621 RepID=A0A238FJM6_9BASI|nr:BQ2448_2966 [Microbotryum intermedium]
MMTLANEWLKPHGDRVTTRNASAFSSDISALTQKPLSLFSRFALRIIICDALYFWLLHHTQRNTGVESTGRGVWSVARWVDRPRGRILAVNQRVMSTIFSVLAQVVWISNTVSNLLLFTGRSHSLNQFIVWRAITALSLVGWFWVLTWGKITSFIIAADPKIDSTPVNVVLVGYGGAQLAAASTTSAHLIARGKIFNNAFRSYQSDLRSKAAAYTDVPGSALADVLTGASALASARRSYFFMFYVLSILSAVIMAVAVVLNLGELILARKIKRQIVFNEKIYASRVATQQVSAQPHEGSMTSNSRLGAPDDNPVAGSPAGRSPTHRDRADPRSQGLNMLPGLRRARSDVLAMCGMVLCCALITMVPLMFNLVEYCSIDVTQLPWAKTEVLNSGASWVITAVMLGAQIVLIWISIAFHKQRRRGVVQLNADGSSVPAPVDAVMLERGPRTTLGGPRSTSTGPRREMGKDQTSRLDSSASQGSNIFVDVDVEVARSGNSEDDLRDMAELD